LAAGGDGGGNDRASEAESLLQSVMLGSLLFDRASTGNSYFLTNARDSDFSLLLMVTEIQTSGDGCTGGEKIKT
jgi:hypothetical protein